MQAASVVAQDTPNAGLTWAPWEGALAQFHGVWEADLIYMWEGRIGEGF